MLSSLVLPLLCAALLVCCSFVRAQTPLTVRCNAPGAPAIVRNVPMIDVAVEVVAHTGIRTDPIKGCNITLTGAANSIRFPTAVSSSSITVRDFMTGIYPGGAGDAEIFDDDAGAVNFLGGVGDRNNITLQRVVHYTGDSGIENKALSIIALLKIDVDMRTAFGTHIYVERSGVDISALEMTGTSVSAFVSLVWIRDATAVRLFVRDSYIKVVSAITNAQTPALRSNKMIDCFVHMRNVSVTVPSATVTSNKVFSPSFSILAPSSTFTGAFLVEQCSLVVNLVTRYDIEFGLGIVAMMFRDAASPSYFANNTEAERRVFAVLDSTMNVSVTTSSKSDFSEVFAVFIGQENTNAPSVATMPLVVVGVRATFSLAMTAALAQVVSGDGWTLSTGVLAVAKTSFIASILVDSCQFTLLNPRPFLIGELDVALVSLPALAANAYKFPGNSIRIRHSNLSAPQLTFGRNEDLGRFDVSALRYDGDEGDKPLTLGRLNIEVDGVRVHVFSPFLMSPADSVALVLFVAPANVGSIAVANSSVTFACNGDTRNGNQCSAWTTALVQIGGGFSASSLSVSRCFVAVRRVMFSTDVELVRISYGTTTIPGRIYIGDTHVDATDIVEQVDSVIFVNLGIAQGSVYVGELLIERCSAQMVAKRLTGVDRRAQQMAWLATELDLVIAVVTIRQSTLFVDSRSVTTAAGHLRTRPSLSLVHLISPARSSAVHSTVAFGSVSIDEVEMSLLLDEGFCDYELPSCSMIAINRRLVGFSNPPRAPTLSITRSSVAIQYAMLSTRTACNFSRASLLAVTNTTEQLPRVGVVYARLENNAVRSGAVDGASSLFSADDPATPRLFGVSSVLSIQQRMLAKCTFNLIGCNPVADRKGTARRLRRDVLASGGRIVNQSCEMSVSDTRSANETASRELTETTPTLTHTITSVTPLPTPTRTAARTPSGAVDTRSRSDDRSATALTASPSPTATRVTDATQTPSATHIVPPPSPRIPAGFKAASLLGSLLSGSPMLGGLLNRQSKLLRFMQTCGDDGGGGGGRRQPPDAAASPLGMRIESPDGADEADKWLAHERGMVVGNIIFVAAFAAATLLFIGVVYALTRDKDNVPIEVDDDAEPARRSVASGREAKRGAAAGAAAAAAAVPPARRRKWSKGKKPLTLDKISRTVRWPGIISIPASLLLPDTATSVATLFTFGTSAVSFVCAAAGAIAILMVCCWWAKVVLHDLPRATVLDGVDIGLYSVQAAKAELLTAQEAARKQKAQEEMSSGSSSGSERDGDDAGGETAAAATGSQKQQQQQQQQRRRSSVAFEEATVAAAAAARGNSNKQKRARPAAVLDDENDSNKNRNSTSHSRRRSSVVREKKKKKDDGGGDAACCVVVDNVASWCLDGVYYKYHDSRFSARTGFMWDMARYPWFFLLSDVLVLSVSLSVLEGVVNGDDVPIERCLGVSWAATIMLGLYLLIFIALKFAFLTRLDVLVAGLSTVVSLLTAVVGVVMFGKRVAARDADESNANGRLPEQQQASFDKMMDAAAVASMMIGCVALIGLLDLVILVREAWRLSVKHFCTPAPEEEGEGKRAAAMQQRQTKPRGKNLKRDGAKQAESAPASRRSSSGGGAPAASSSTSGKNVRSRRPSAAAAANNDNDDDEPLLLSPAAVQGAPRRVSKQSHSSSDGAAAAAAIVTTRVGAARRRSDDAPQQQQQQAARRRSNVIDFDVDGGAPAAAAAADDEGTEMLTRPTLCRPPTATPPRRSAVLVPRRRKPAIDDADV